MGDKTILKQNVIQVRRGGEPLFFFGFYGYLFLTDTSLICKYFLFGIPWGKKKLRVLGILPKVLTIPLTGIQSIGKLIDTVDTLVIHYKQRENDKTVYFKFWINPVFNAPAKLYDEWIKAIDFAKNQLEEVKTAEASRSPR